MKQFLVYSCGHPLLLNYDEGYYDPGVSCVNCCDDRSDDINYEYPAASNKQREKWRRGALVGA